MDSFSITLAVYLRLEEIKEICKRADGGGYFTDLILNLRVEELGTDLSLLSPPQTSFLTEASAPSDDWNKSFLGRFPTRLSCLSRGFPQELECIVCAEQKPFADVLPLSCGHCYCHDCLTSHFERSTSDEGSFPPRCCQAIPIGSAVDILSPDLVSRFRAKAIEFSTLNRTYCSRGTCSAFIPPLHISSDVGTCPSCEHQTCTFCKQTAHIGYPCPHDSDRQMVVAMAWHRGWKQCYSCKNMVERSGGCSHMKSATSLC